MRITGQSMSPRIRHGSYILLFASKTFITPKMGQTWLIKHEQYGLIIKTLVAEKPYATFWFKSEHHLGVTCDEIGPITSQQLVAKVILTVSANL